MLTKVKYILLENPNDKFGKVIKEEEIDASINYENEILIYAELSGDFPLGDSRQPIYKSLRPFDLVS